MFKNSTVSINLFAGPGQQHWEPGKVLFGALLECFGVQVEGLRGPFGVYFRSRRAQVEVWEAKKQQGRGLKRAWVGSGAAGDPQRGPT